MKYWWLFRSIEKYRTALYIVHCTETYVLLYVKLCYAVFCAYVSTVMSHSKNNCMYCYMYKNIYNIVHATTSMCRTRTRCLASWVLKMTETKTKINNKCISKTCSYVIVVSFWFNNSRRCRYGLIVCVKKINIQFNWFSQYIDARRARRRQFSSTILINNNIVRKLVDYDYLLLVKSMVCCMSWWIKIVTLIFCL